MTRHVRRTFAVFLATLGIALSAAGHAAAAVPGTNGRITFMRFDADGWFQIWVANADMTNQVQITHGVGGSGFPSWSPDGTRIVFDSHRTDPDQNDAYEISDVFTMKPDGTDVVKLTDSVGFSGHPSWSPDGRWVIFDADRADYPRSQGLYVVRSDGSGGLRRITALPAGSIWQELGRFSPDGSRIVFDEGRGGNVLPNRREGTVVGEGWALFSVRPDGTDRRQLTTWGSHCGDADWSPDGKRIVCGGQPTHAGNIGDILILDADGKHLKDLTQDHGVTGTFQAPNSVWYEESFNPTWSPDGRTITFIHASYTAADGFRQGIQQMNPDGTGRIWLSQGEEHQPEIGPAPAP